VVWNGKGELSRGAGPMLRIPRWLRLVTGICIVALVCLSVLTWQLWPVLLEITRTDRWLSAPIERKDAFVNEIANRRFANAYAATTRRYRQVTDLRDFQALIERYPALRVGGNLASIASVLEKMEARKSVHGESKGGLRILRRGERVACDEVIVLGAEYVKFTVEVVSEDGQWYIDQFVIREGTKNVMDK
jgi:hypothetical protein